MFSTADFFLDQNSELQIVQESVLWAGGAAVVAGGGKKAQAVLT